MKTNNTKFHAVIGDLNPIEHDGGVVFDRGHGPEVVYFQGWHHDEEGPQVCVATFMVEDDVLEDLDWVDWKSVADLNGMEVDELKKWAKSEDVVDRALVYERVAAYCGYGELDSQRRDMPLEEAEKEFGEFVDAAHAAK